jgi:hypothetical protein
MVNGLTPLRGLQGVFWGTPSAYTLGYILSRLRRS